MLHRGTVPDTLYLSGETSDNDCEMGACCGEEDELCLCATAPCPLYPDAHCTQMSVKIQCCRSLEPSAASAIATQEETLTCEHHGKDRLVITRYSEGYGTEEECVLSDPQGESDADADIEDTDCRLHEAGSLQRISSRRRKRPRVARQDTTESEDDGGRSHRTHRWDLRLSPHPAQSKTILEDSVSQVRPLVICRPSAADGVRTSSDDSPRSPRCRLSRWPSSLPLPLALLILLFLLLLFALVIFVTS